ncbi:MAG TPA: NeuD/PglB/VioB family sugar acetyltransferase [Flavobacterium sp.]|uniref:NeuD/PglB/VioB family sugar acetyltransferase n=1 Tax=Flavobacterium sp. TaxID=239 RepID=UPI002CBCE190|nr:NeuD/PglB/VioB family sugar acetyltransferase [Flavobacterium sp.]HPW98891.1 NeuD/PglB/VioB family sugar acetyltransferase [Flavobacterium sp.]HQA73655.1 NeuD/PglB/VioB family sugar acetyltransferase [Flavobacterium sp.]
MKKKLLIVGAGSVGKFVAYNIDNFTQEFEIIGFLDDDISKQNTEISGYFVIGSVEKLSEFSGKNVAIVWGIAFPEIKKRLLNEYKHLDFEYPNFISKKAWISNQVTFGKGCIVYPGNSINYETQVEDFVVINMNCAIGHNCIIGSFTSLSPGVNLGGNTTIGDDVELGIGSATVQGISIGNNTKVGGQAMVAKSIASHQIVRGIPAKSIQ